MTCARSLRWMVSVWTPKNTIRPRIITSSPMMSLPLRGWLSGLSAYHFNGLVRNAPRPLDSRLPGLPAEIAIVDIADRNRPPRERTTQSTRELEGHAGGERFIDRLEVGGAGIGRDARR